MPMDALCLSAVLAETERNILGAGAVIQEHSTSRSRDQIFAAHPGRERPLRLLLSGQPQPGQDPA